MITWHDGPSVTIDGEGNEWSIYTAKIDCLSIADEFPELHITSDEAATVVERLLERLEEDMYEYMEDRVKEVR